MIKNIREVKECPECGSDEIEYNDNKQQIVCRACGMIYEPMTEMPEEQFEKAAGLEEGPKASKGKKKR